MYAHVITFVIGSGTEQESERMAAEAMLWLHDQDGFVGANFLADYENGEHKWITFWDTVKEPEVHKKELSKMQELIGNKYLWGVKIEEFQVLWSQ
ncbi:hypothetical protein NZD89_19415 [Alicyclobacillus fastidiosus]|uniref:ABM domain-containing protein n=1 Tax=Alicyclobacillus fastidiosus TaxID=392011 RepID=A0ABY6ZC92_9BACL|nr:hypothetical protein [Alicyclobacillus fastidiosus]WAH40482.1 hypothetical protein NZD89_19415 [Alicyclobacillus fastidiosus]GMA61893.1 hypothetical protein GCM10025859_23330 [Alicyclobacillus fastidiosus]